MKLDRSTIRRLVLEEITRSRVPQKRSLASFIFEENAPAWDSKYEEFVNKLASNASDPKVQAFISAGQLDKNDADDKFTFADVELNVKDLTPTQNEIDVDKSLSYPLEKASDFIKYVAGDGVAFAPGGNPIVTYNGKYVIDGHHRWSQVYACNSRAKIKAVDIQISGLEPLEVLKAVQAAIAIDTKKVPVQSVKGINLLKIDESGLNSWIGKKVNMAFFGKVAADSDTMSKMKNSLTEAEEGEVSDEDFKKSQELVEKYVWSNVKSMQETSQPVAGAPKRDFMPQTDNVNWKEPLEKGLVDISEPHASKTESRSRGEKQIMERWQRLAGILKG